MTTSADEILAVLHTSHDRLVELLDDVGDGTQPSYCRDWSIADVASHLGSGAEIFGLYLDAGLAGEPAPEALQPVWDRWNAEAPADQVADAAPAVAAFLARVDALSPEQRESWRLNLFGSEQDLASLLRLRSAELSVHSWDIAVTGDARATIPTDEAELVLELLPGLAMWSGRDREEQLSVEVRTTAPERALHLDVGPGGVRLTPSYDDTAAAELVLPAEAWVRLVYGRLDGDHTPSDVVVHGADLDLLRSVFPGF